MEAELPSPGEPRGEFTSALAPPSTRAAIKLYRMCRHFSASRGLTRAGIEVAACNIFDATS
jgi:hypothetical protein